MLYLKTIIHKNNVKDLKVNKSKSEACYLRGSYSCLQWSHESQETVDFDTV